MNAEKETIADRMIEALNSNNEAMSGLCAAMREFTNSSIELTITMLNKKYIIYLDKYIRSNFLTKWYYECKMRKAKYEFIMFTRSVKYNYNEQ